MDKPLFTGTCTALVTPFVSDQVNYSMLEKLLQFQIDAGIHTIVLCGTTGESPTLSDKEKISIFRHAKQYCGDNCTIIAGTGSNATRHSVELSLAAQDAGVDGLLIVSPYYNKSNPDGLYRHFSTIAKNTTLPIILYNVPTRTGVDIPISVYQALAKLQNIVGVKEANSDITKIAKIKVNCPDDFYIWSGNDDQIVPVMSLGGIGVISVLSNIYPKETQYMTQCALLHNFQTASKIQCAMLPMIELLFREVNPIPVKYAMDKIGFDCGPCRLPLGTLSADIQKAIDTYLAK